MVGERGGVEPATEGSRSAADGRADVAPAGASAWVPPGWRDIVRWPMPAANFGDRWIVRLISLLAIRQIRAVHGLEHVSAVHDPFILAVNHSIKREALLLPALIVLHRSGKWVRFLVDWNFVMIPVVGRIMRRSGAIVVTRKSARPKALNHLKRFYTDPLPAAERARAHLMAGESVGVFPEGTVNRDARRLLTGRVGMARLSLESGVPVVPVGVRFPDADPRLPIAERSAMEIHIGAPLKPPAAPGDKPPIVAVRGWHATVMTEIARLSGKAWGREAGESRMRDRHVTTQRVSDEAGRQEVVSVLRATYQREKQWVSDPDSQFPPADLERTDISWFVAKVSGRPVGVVRMFYDPPIAAYAESGFKLLDDSIRVEDFIDRPGLAEIGRFAVLPDNRRQIVIAAALMRAAAVEGVERGCTHLLTDIFEDDPHSPYGFHTRVLGFRPVATHDTGELDSASRRITLLLDISAAYKRLRTRGHWFYRFLTHDWPDTLHQKLAA